jgi:glutamine phosphoribosylpyrophosphate amidotransferase
MTFQPINLMVPKRSMRKLLTASANVGINHIEYIRRSLAAASLIQEHMNKHPDHKLAITQNGKIKQELILFDVN